MNDNSNKGIKREVSPVDELIHVTKKKGRRIIESDDESSAEEQSVSVSEIKMDVNEVEQVHKHINRMLMLVQPATRLRMYCNQCYSVKMKIFVYHHSHPIHSRC